MAANQLAIEEWICPLTVSHLNANPKAERITVFSHDGRSGRVHEGGRSGSDETRCRDAAIGCRPPDIDQLRQMQSVICEAARRGQGIIIGHGSQVLLHGFGCAMNDLITSQEESRIRNLMRQMELPREVAERLIHAAEKQKKGFFRHAFHRDWNDPAFF